MFQPPTSKNPRSVTRAFGMTESPMNASVPKGEGRVLPERPRRIFDLFVAGGDVPCRKIRQQPRNREREMRFDLAIGDDRQSPLAFRDDGDGGQDVGVIHADRHDVVRVMRDRAGDRAALESKSLDQAHADLARRVMALDADDLEEIADGSATAKPSRTSGSTSATSVTIWPGMATTARRAFSVASRRCRSITGATFIVWNKNSGASIDGMFAMHSPFFATTVPWNNVMATVTCRRSLSSTRFASYPGATAPMPWSRQCCAGFQVAMVMARTGSSPAAIAWRMMSSRCPFTMRSMAIAVVGAKCAAMVGHIVHDRQKLVEIVLG